MHAGGLSIALAGDSGAKKRGLSQLNGGGGSSASDGFGAVGTSSAGGDGQHQQTYHQLPAGGLSSQLGSGTFPAIGQLYSSRGDSGNYSGFSSYNPDASPALSPLSATTPHGSQRSPLSEALAISAGAPRRKMPRRHPAPPGDASAAGNSFGEDYAALAQSDASDDDDFAVPMPGMPMSMRSGGGAAGGWAIAGAPPHLMTSGAMSLPHHASAAELAHGGFRPVRPLNTLSSSQFGSCLPIAAGVTARLNML